MERFIYSRTYHTPADERGMEMFSVVGLDEYGRLLMCSSRKESKAFPVNVVAVDNMETCEFLFGRKNIRLRADRFISRGFKANIAKDLLHVNGQWLPRKEAKLLINELDHSYENRPNPQGFINSQGDSTTV